VPLLGSGGDNGKGVAGFQTVGAEPLMRVALILTTEDDAGGGDTGLDELPEIVALLPLARGGIE